MRRSLFPPRPCHLLQVRARPFLGKVPRGKEVYTTRHVVGAAGASHPQELGLEAARGIS
jgi:hypothetical protein